MKTNKNTGNVQKQIDKIKEKLSAIGDMRPGSLSKQFNICGNPNCRCKHPTNPKKHGPYYQLSYVHLGKSTSRFVKPHHRKLIASQLANYKKFKSLTSKWVQLALKKSELIVKMNK